ncbi:penicillin-insensitive murein endopeptidase [Salipiger sp. P9]|uniref:penicillin-insensitive murein endopeptidase n=1 Tax=Salipiger pentaromativorans TaxID=2943193 RepID=UPI002157B0C4|nr:penicillin-insensitive murein endopeptidase [Salipiger pentaromativorans]MCR8548291.1 penicillin-insensitive murein endopeptidase [Salipiger pentaromativorans]
MIRTLFALALAATALTGCGGERPTPAAKQQTVQPRVTGVLSTKNAKALFGAEHRSSAQKAASYGSYAKGCLAGGVQLPQSGPTWQAMRLSRNRNWGHPVLVDFLEDLSRKAAAQPGWNGLYIGDLSQPRGGPMTSGHASHQIGLDADIWMRPANDLTLSTDARENISSISMWRSSGAYTNDKWTRAHHEIIKAAAKDPRVARIFVFPGAKVQMCNDETGDRAWLRKIRPWYGHHYHFHVRLNCPAGAAGCVDQTPPPAGDGCADAQAWVNNILNPPPPDPNAPKPQPKRELTMGDLPAQCASVLAAQ